jgi:hypothetical protein
MVLELAISLAGRVVMIRSCTRKREEMVKNVIFGSADRRMTHVRCHACNVDVLVVKPTGRREEKMDGDADTRYTHSAAV